MLTVSRIALIGITTRNAKRWVTAMTTVEGLIQQENHVTIVVLPRRVIMGGIVT